MLAKVSSATLLGVAGECVTVEVHVARGLPGFSIVGLPDTSCRESRDRVRAAILSSGFSWPNTRMTVNLAPSDITKVGTGLDLAIAVGLLVADGQLDLDLTELAFIGELGLDGSLRGVAGMLPMASALTATTLVVPEDSARQVGVLQRFDVVALASLSQLETVGAAGWPPAPQRAAIAVEPSPTRPDLNEVRGHRFARFALEVAAAGGHHVLMVGPPGAGKTMLAERLPPLLGALDQQTALEVTMVHSAAGQELPAAGLISLPPFRSPHHTASRVALIGGGSRRLRPGEVSLAHGGVLFIDELGEFPAAVLDALRQPLEEGVIRISRAHAHASMPARFQLVAAMNPCPCGFAGSGRCRCSEAALARYRRRLSGPLLDRFDIRLSLAVASTSSLLEVMAGESTSDVAMRVSAARVRASGRGCDCNARLTAAELERHAPLGDEAMDVLRGCLDDGSLSGRGLRRIRSVALTLRDLADEDGELGAEAVASAIALRADVMGFVDHAVVS